MSITEVIKTASSIRIKVDLNHPSQKKLLILMNIFQSRRMLQVIRNIELQVKIDHIHFENIAPPHKIALGCTDEE